MRQRPLLHAPVWLVGLSNLTFGLSSGFLVVPLPQLLSAEHVSVPRIAAISAVALSPGLWTFLFGPLLDVWVSRRCWAAVFACLSGAGMSAALLTRGHLRTMEVLLMLGYAAAVLSANALGGWCAEIIPNEQQAVLSAWNQVAVFVGNGVMVVLAGRWVTAGTTSAEVASGMGVLVAAPALIFLFMPADTVLRPGAGESFQRFARDLRALSRRRPLWGCLLLFLLPTGSFALTNSLGGISSEWHASRHFVSVMGGLGLTLVGSAACLLLPVLFRRVAPLLAYLVIGSAGSLWTLSLLLTPRTPLWFGVAFLSENALQAISFTAAVAITFRTIGRDNPMAVTQFGLLLSATVVPILYMGVLDGRVFAAGGLHGMLLVDGGVSLLACAVVAWLLRGRPTLQDPLGTDALRL